MAQTIDRKLILAAFGLMATVLLIFRRELMPFFFHESPLKEFEFRRPPPSLDTLTKAQGVAPTNGKTSLLIQGANFGNDASVIHVSIGVNYCTNIQLVSETKLTCTIPPGVGKDLAVIVVVNGLATSKPLYFSYDAPSIQQISATKGPTSGKQSLTINGVNFGPEDTWVTGYIGEFRSPNTRWLTPNAVEMVTPKGFGKDLSLYLVVGDQKSVEQVKYSYEAPSIESIKPETGPTTGGVIVTVRGSNFGPRYSLPSVSVGGKNCVFTTWRDDELLECSLPDGIGLNKAVVVSVGEQKSSEKINFSYDAPSISSINPISGPPAGKTPITIMGTNFGHMGDPVVKFSSGACAVKSVTDTEIVCDTPAGKEGQTNVIVTVGGQVNNPPAVWFYGVSKITEIVPSHGKATGGYPITIKGAMLGTSDADILSITIGDRPCRGIEWKSPSELVCTAPAGTGKSKVIVQIGDHNIESTFTYDEAAITINSVRFIDINTLEIKGTNMDLDADVEFPYAKCFVNERQSKPSEGILICDVRQEKLGDILKDMSVVVSLGSISSKRFELGHWTVNTPIPSKGATTTPTIVVPISYFPTVSRDKYDWISVEINEKVADVTGSEDGKLIISLRPAQTSMLDIKISLGETVLGSTVFNYDAPKVDSTTIKDNKIVVIGSNFGAIDANAKFEFVPVTANNSTSPAVECTSVSVDHKKITCGLKPDFAKASYTVKLTVLGATFTLKIA